MFTLPVMFREESAAAKGAEFAAKNKLDPIEVGMMLGAALVGKHDAVLRKGRAAWRIRFDDGVFTIVAGDIADTSFNPVQPSLRA